MKQDVVDQLVEAGQIELVPDTDPQQYRMTKDQIVDNQTVIVKQAWPAIMSFAADLNEFVDTITTALQTVARNEPFSLDEIEFVDDEEPGAGASPGYL